MQVLHPSAMFPAQHGTCDLAIRVRNSYNLNADGTVIVEQREDLNRSLMTSIVLKEDVHLLDICSTRMLGSFGFLARVFDVFRQEQISVDVVATSEISVSVTLDSSKLWSRGLIAEELENLALRFKGVAEVEVQPGVSIISLICNAQRSSAILKQVNTPTLTCLLEFFSISDIVHFDLHMSVAIDLFINSATSLYLQVFTVLDDMKVNVKMISQVCLFGTSGDLSCTLCLSNQWPVLCRVLPRPTYRLLSRRNMRMQRFNACMLIFLESVMNVLPVKQR